jgi:hypothetical protein
VLPDIAKKQSRLSRYEYARICRMLKIRLSPKQHMAAKYLELRGKRFCADFGYENAIGLAREMWRNQLQPKPTLRSIGGR